MNKERMTIEQAKKEMTRDQYIKFYILVPFYSSMEMKRQNEIKRLTKASAHPIYNHAAAKIEEVIKEWNTPNE